MSTTEQPEVSTGSTGSTEGGAAPAKDGAGQLKETERVQAGPGGPGRGPFGGGMVGQKAHDFKPNAKRLISRMAPERTKAIGVIILAVASVGLMSVARRERPPSRESTKPASAHAPSSIARRSALGLLLKSRACRGVSARGPRGAKRSESIG